MGHQLLWSIALAAREAAGGRGEPPRPVAAPKPPAFID
jgi:hypothetical protein